MTCQLEQTAAPQHTAERTDQIARLNDRARMGFDRRARIVMTAGLLATLASGDDPRQRIMAQARTMRAVRECTFGADCPERDTAWFEIDGHRVMLKIDCYDESLEWGSPDPADAAITIRVVTIMLTHEY